LCQPVGLVNFRLIEGREGNIYVGVLLFSRINEKSTCRHVGAISYKLRGGRELFENGERASEVVEQVRKGDVLSLLVEANQARVRWYRNGQFILQRPIPVEMRGRKLYPFVTMINEGDEI